MGPISRRVVLAGAGALAASGGLVAAVALQPPAEGASLLSAAELAVVDAIAEVYFPGVHLPLDGAQARVGRRVDALLEQVLDPMRRKGFRAVLYSLEVGTLASRGRRFTALSVVERTEVLDAWSDPEWMPRRVAGDSLRALLGMAYYGHPEIQAALGWRVGCDTRRS